MAMQLEANKSFEAVSPVARYWLAQCHGFRIAGAGRGTVEQIVSNSDPHEAEVLVVRDIFRRREVPVSAVEAVVPAERLIVLRKEDGARDKRRRVRTAGRVATRMVASAGHVVVQSGSPRVRRVGARSKRVGLAIGLALVAFARLVGGVGHAAGRGATVAAAWSVATFRVWRRYAVVVVGPAFAALVRGVSARGSAVVRGSVLAATSSIEASQARRRSRRR